MTPEELKAEAVRIAQILRQTSGISEVNVEDPEGPGEPFTITYVNDDNDFQMLELKILPI